MNVYARARDERLTALAEKVGETVLAREKRALCVHKGEEGAQGESPKLWQAMV